MEIFLCFINNTSLNENTRAKQGYCFVMLSVLRSNWYCVTRLVFGTVISKNSLVKTLGIAYELPSLVDTPIQ